MNINEFRDEVLEEIKLNVSIEENSNNQEEFLKYVTDVLIDAEEIDEFNYLPFEGLGKRNKKIQIDGYSYNELEEYLTIFTCTTISSNDSETLTSTESDKYFSKAQAFIEESDYILENAEESSPGYGLAYDIKNTYKKVKRYRIYLVTDRIMSSKIKNIKAGDINGIPVEYNIWDISRLYQIVTSGNAKEDIVINLTEYTKNGIPALPASSTEDYDSYLCIIPGIVLANLYNEYGGRLLEGNVRSFLQTKGKVNKGIRNTILNDPSKFFAYNNGIAGTASKIEKKNIGDSTYISEITDLQIVNGGQTTASLATALLNDKKDGSENSIKNIFVPMKLSVVSDLNKAQELIPNISRYANSQNKVSEADLWSNHPFHIRMEKFSRSVLAPAVDGKQYGTHWYYERANGQYKQETYKSTAAEKKKFELLNPSNQMFKKIDLAKLWNIQHCRPDIASAGGVKSFSEFASYVTNQWEKDETIFNQRFFEDIISMNIIFKEADKVVKRQPWYNSYKANIVAYTISRLIYEINSKYPYYDIPLHDIWLKQRINNEWIKQLEISSKIIYDFLISENRQVENVTEWAKRQRCWDAAKDVDIKITEGFISSLAYKENIEQEKKDARKDQRLNNNINIEMEIFNFGVENWKYLLEWDNSHKVLTPKEIDFVKVAIGMEKRWPTEKQCAKIWEALQHAREESFPK